MIEKLRKRLDGYKKKMEKNEQEFKAGRLTFEQYFYTRFELDKKVAIVFELDKKRIRDTEFSESQLDVFFDTTWKVV